MSTDWAAHDLTVQNYHGGNLAATSRIRHVLIAAITAGDIAPGARLKEIDTAVKATVTKATEFAQTSPEPDPSELFTDILLPLTDNKLVAKV